jgi:hypothetical protein
VFVMFTVFRYCFFFLVLVNCWGLVLLFFVFEIFFLFFVFVCTGVYVFYVFLCTGVYVFCLYVSLSKVRTFGLFEKL